MISTAVVMDLFAWAELQPGIGHNGGPSLDSRPQRPQRTCIDCGVTISAYSRGRCRSCGYVGLKRTVPDGFIDVLRSYGSVGAAKHFHASLSTVTRWRKEIDLTPHMRAKKGRSHGTFLGRSFIDRPLLVKRDWSPAGQAAEFLRRLSPLFRCDASGRPNTKGEMWNRNGWLLTDDEVMIRARRMGWREMEV